MENSYRFCEQMVVRHYENFPVASWFLPARLRRPIAVIYAFARTADDLADEGSALPGQRLKALDDYEQKLRHSDTSDDPVFIALSDVMQKHQLPVQLFHDLLNAFRSDITKKRYGNFQEVLEYCRLSANPIGRLLVHLNNKVSDDALHFSDKICTALQLINFYQDLNQDYTENNRIYVPLDEIKQFNVTEDHFKSSLSDDSMQKLMRFQVQRARDMLSSGTQLGKILTGRAGFELRMVISGGLIVCQKLLKNPDVFARPRLTKTDWIKMSWGALSRNYPANISNSK